ncbi:MAG: glycoside hydrolase family 9 protein [Erysipelotrichaceae bacterium]|nr:glycoside hydrolase family 9 protein [Erysipelotrichaceae bacterium]
MKKFLTCLLCIFICASCFNKKSESVVEPTITEIPETIKTRENLVPLYVEDIPFESSWSIIASDGNGVSHFEYNDVKTEILYPGANIGALAVYREGIPFSKDANYVLTFESESSVNRNIQIIASDDKGNILFDNIIQVGEKQNHSFDLKMNFDTSWNGKIQFNIGNDGSENMQTQHTVSLKNILLKTSDIDTRNVKVNQLGYLPNAQKKFVVPYNVGDYYNVIDTKTNQIVYTGKIGRELVNEGSKETNYYGNFSELTTPGTYIIQTQIVLTSFEFNIENSVYDGLLVDALKMLSLQRSGSYLDESWAKGFARENSHFDLAYIYDTDKTIDVSGGWYDAGDYGRYIKTGFKAVMDLLLAYSFNPQYFGDNFNMADSNNNNSDLLDEVKHELNWMFKMQDSSGGVYNKVVSKDFAGYVSPEDDKSKLYVLPISTNATADFAGAMAYASIIFKDLDKDYADKCLNASKKAYDYLQANPEMNDPLNPEKFDAGEYRDDSDLDERLFAASALFYATNESQYLQKAKELVEKDERSLLGLNWQTVGTYGEYLLLKNEKTKDDIDFYNRLYNHFMAQADSMLNFASTDGYFLTLQNNYNWGSNMDVANNGMLLMLADDISPNDNYVDKAFDQLHYLLGRNSLNISFITGYGDVYPQNIHNRMTIAKNIEMVGALVGGPNRNLEDAIVKEYFNENTPYAKVYIDHNMSYSTNEVAIYWNSVLVFLISSLKR